MRVEGARFVPHPAASVQTNLHKKHELRDNLEPTGVNLAK
jgi:hypothetical protein